MELMRYKPIAKDSGEKVVFLILDGLGGLPYPPHGQTALERANCPNLDALAAESICGLHEPAGPGVTPGSGPAHLALFGYDPHAFQVGRGVLSALGVGFELQPGDVAARGNFCTVDSNGVVTDRRAGRISDEENRRRAECLRGISIPGAEVFVETIKEHRFLLVLRGPKLGADVSDTDPGATGIEPLEPAAANEASQLTAEAAGAFVREAQSRLAEMAPANMVLLRGFAQLPEWPGLPERFGIRCAAIAAYPMYCGVATLGGMDAYAVEESMEAKLAKLDELWNAYDFFFIHIKKTDSAAEDGDFESKAQAITDVDAFVPRLLEKQPGALVITGDHSTPALMKAHSWHPVPTLLWSPRCRPDGVATFTEQSCLAGGLGPRIETTRLLPLALAHAGRFKKFGA